MSLPDTEIKSMKENISITESDEIQFHQPGKDSQSLINSNKFYGEENKGNEEDDYDDGVEEEIEDDKLFENHSINSEPLNLDFLSEKFYICPDCKDYFSYKYISPYHMNIECGCRFLQNFTFNQFSKNCKKIATDDKPISCKTHNKTFIKYCKDCKIDLCEDCEKEKAKTNNSTGNVTEHETHDLINLINVSQTIKKNKIFDIEKYDGDDIKTMKNIAINMLKNFDNFPTYRGYKAMKSIVQILMQLRSKSLKKINSIQQLKENITKPHLIYKIEIDGEKTKEILKDLNLFKNKNFRNLKKLQMNNIKKLKDIKALSSCSFPNLKKLIIGCAILTDDCIDTIKQLKLPKIKFISLFGNKITSPEIFSSVQNFDTLEKFYIGSNPIDIKKLPNEKIIYNIFLLI